MARGQISLMVEGKVLKDVLKSGTFIVLRYMDGTSHTIEWVDSHGTPIRGEPRMRSEGWHIFAKAPQLKAKYKPRESGLLVPCR